MNKINLFNRDGATLWLEEENLVEPFVSEWKLKVDSKHKYCLKYMRTIGKEGYHDISNPDNWKAVDPSGGPFISLGDIFTSNCGNNYQIVKIKDKLTFWLNERDNN